MLNDMTISLIKKGDFHQINLEKHNTQPLDICVNLNWNRHNARTGFISSLFGINKAPDLDLGCMYETTNGVKGVIQALGNSFGAKDAFPFIWLDKDDRTGAASDGENITVYRPEMIKRIVFFAFIYEGAKDFQSFGGRMSFDISNGEKVFLELNNPDRNSTFCAAATIVNRGSNVKITKEERYFKNHISADKYYKFGFNWKFGSK